MNKLIITALVVTLMVPGCASVNKTADNADKDNSAVLNDVIAKAAKENGAVLTSSGMVYRSIQDGSGNSPVKSSTVEVKYRGTLPDGTEFDSNNRIKFKLARVIPCWTEGLQMMKVGGIA